MRQRATRELRLLLAYIAYGPYWLKHSDAFGQVLAQHGMSFIPGDGLYDGAERLPEPPED